MRFMMRGGREVEETSEGTRPGMIERVYKKRASDLKLIAGSPDYYKADIGLIVDRAGWTVLTTMMYALLH